MLDRPLPLLSRIVFTLQIHDIIADPGRLALSRQAAGFDKNHSI
jgi:hypothetical protein